MGSWLAQTGGVGPGAVGLPWWVPAFVGIVIAIIVVIRLSVIAGRLFEGAPGTPRALRSEAKAFARRGEHDRAGDLFRAAGDLEAAIEEYKQAGFPNKAGDVLAARGQFELAAPLFERASFWEPAADAYRRAGNLKKAEACFLKVGKKLHVARMYEDAGQHAKAANYYKEVGKNDKAADLLERLGRAGEAAELCEKLYFHSLAGLSDKKAAAAKEDARRLEERTVALYRRAEMLDKALEFYIRAGLYSKAAELCLEIGKPDRAIELFLRCGKEDQAAKLLDARGETLKSARLRGDHAMRNNELFSAARHYEEAGEMRLAAEAYEKLGDFPRAAASYEKAGDLGQAAFFHARIGNYAQAGQLYEQVGDLEAALRCYETLKDDGKRAQILAKAGKHLRAGTEFYRINRWDEAIAALQKVDAASTDSGAAAAMLGVAFMEKGMPRVALEKLEEGYSRSGVGTSGGISKVDYFYARGRALEAMGDIEKAVEMLEKVVSVDAEYKDAMKRLPGLQARLVEPMSRTVSSVIMGGSDGKTEMIVMHSGIAAPPTAHEGTKKYALPGGRSTSVLASGSMNRAPAGGADPPTTSGPGGRAPDPRPGSDKGLLQQGRYRIMEELGRGGMGVVYKCHDTLLDRVVGYKVLSAQIRDFPAALENFLREAKSAARLHHPNVVTIFDFGESENGYYMTLEYVAGKNLRQFMKTQPDKETVRRVLVGICEGLAYAHAQSVVHRDIKPSNILVSDPDNRAKILDFGLAKILEDVSATASGVLGTPWYMSPEQVLGTSIDHRSDIYSLGVTLFEVLTGELPFKGRDFGYHHVHTIPPTPRSVTLGVTEDVDRVIMRCLEKKPEDRWPNASEMGEALRKAAM